MSKMTMRPNIALLAGEVVSFLRHLKHIDTSQVTLSNYFKNSMKSAFWYGGLDAVDLLIDEINEAIKERLSPVGLGTGVALEHADNDTPKFLHVYFVEFATDGIISRDVISLT